MLDYYDIAYDTCNISKSFETALGYKRIFLASKDIKIIEGNSKGSDISGSIFIDSGRSNAISILNMSPSAIAFLDSRINKKTLEQMRERGIVLCIPVSILTNSYGLQRSRNLYMMSKLFSYAKGIKLDVSFATLAKSNAHLCSYMQLVELAKLIGADEEYARKSISVTNRNLVIK